MGELAGDNKSIVSGGSVDPRATTWTMDVLGNWNGDAAVSPALPGRKVLGAYLLGDPRETLRSTTHTTGFDNSLQSVATVSDLTGSATVAQAFDRCGNLVADDQFVYQYDAWHRLMMVGQRGTLTFDAQGEPTGGEAGPWLIQYTHDGLGRVIRKLLPWPQSPQTQQSEHLLLRRGAASPGDGDGPAGGGRGPAGGDHRRERRLPAAAGPGA